MTATEYNARAELGVLADARLLSDPDWADATLSALAPYSPALARSPHGRMEVVLTLPAQDLTQATRTALAVLADVRTPAGAPMTVYAVEVLPTVEFDRRAHLVEVPPLLSIPQAAAELGISRQAVLKRIEAGSLTATRVGTAWAVPAAAIPPPAETDDIPEGSASTAATTSG